MRFFSVDDRIPRNLMGGLNTKLIQANSYGEDVFFIPFGTSDGTARSIRCRIDAEPHRTLNKISGFQDPYFALIDCFLSKNLKSTGFACRFTRRPRKFISERINFIIH